VSGRIVPRVTVTARTGPPGGLMTAAVSGRTVPRVTATARTVPLGGLTTAVSGRTVPRGTASALTGQVDRAVPSAAAMARAPDADRTSAVATHAPATATAGITHLPTPSA